MANLLKLYYVEGISRTDTPLFDNIENQRQYYENRRVVTIPDSFYPPHYRNEISLVLGDYFTPSKASQMNYLSLEYLGRVYYYFIDSIEYKNEDIATLKVTMDVIQTYMFDINYHNARVRRETIKRWNGDYINRDYIRENYTSDIFINKINADLTLLKQETGILLCKTKFPDTSDQIFTTGYITATNVIQKEEYFGTYSTYNDGSFIVMIPNVTNSGDDNTYNNPSKALDSSFIWRASWSEDDNNYINDYTLNQKDINRAVSMISEGYVLIKDKNKAYKKCAVNEIYYIPFMPFTDVTFNSSYNSQEPYYQFNYKTYSNKDPYEREGYEVYNADKVGDYQIPDCVLVYSCNLGECYLETHTLSFEKNIPQYENNKLILKTFDKKYIPQLIDENYIKFEFGERIKRTSFPLSKLKSLNLYLYRGADILTGARSYCIKENNNEPDRYLTRIVIDTKELALMWNDAWKNYYTGHQGSLTLAKAFDTASYVGSLSNIVSKYMKRPVRLGKTTKRALKGYNLSKKETEEFINDDIEPTLEEVVNKVFTPDTISQGNNYTADVMANSLHTVKIYEECSNIDSVATIYESIGYMVDKFVQGNPLLQNRKLYNYIECETIDVTLRNCINDSDTIDLIEERYQDGIRFWNVDFLRDNNINLELGDVCIYDNVENE